VSNLKVEAMSSQKSRFIVVGSIGTVGTWAIYTLIYASISLSPKAIVAKIISFPLGVTQQYTLHRKFTFERGLEVPFLDGLWKSHITYAGSFVISTITHGILVYTLDVYHQFSWVVSTGLGVIWNYLVLSRFVFAEKVEG
jgi:putative flippase GtrA